MGVPSTDTLTSLALNARPLFAADDGGLAGIIAGCGAFGVVWLLVLVVVIAGAWKVFAKAGQPGWASLVPFYNTYVFVVEIAKKDMVWFLLTLFIPFAGIIPCMDVAEKFGKSRAYGLGLAFLPFIFFPMLGFGSAQYRGAAGKSTKDDENW